MHQLWPFLDPLVVAAAFYGSETSLKVVSIRAETVRGPVFGRVAEKCEGFLKICDLLIRDVGMVAEQNGMIKYKHKQKHRSMQAPA